MFCPNCGAAEQNPDAYCRRCGEWLPDQKKNAGRHTASRPADRMKTMMVFNGVSAMLALTSAIALYATYLGRPEAKWSIYVAGAFCTVIAVHQTVTFFMALGLMQKFGRGRALPGSATLGAGRDRGSKASGPVAALGSVETGQLIDAPSVTEETTRLLEENR